ncbi:hypothetical protein PACTADRAFT_48800 [Pachysolen tannophilus NRRL Y-2460]|uniref:Glutathione peroxidase n=1 Tax=Pachysolen tannophilus NRRL Y-2460 TaxID=669874 RepID=A0A1E4TZ56_PACTA|nr:hypothetical protein PACTADRAFT_48800 [Pachysolen tannophilus NRRL Y-2460]
MANLLPIPSAEALNFEPQEQEKRESTDQIIQPFDKLCRISVASEASAISSSEISLVSESMFRVENNHVVNDDDDDDNNDGNNGYSNGKELDTNINTDELELPDLNDASFISMDNSITRHSEDRLNDLSLRAIDSDYYNYAEQACSDQVNEKRRKKISKTLNDNNITIATNSNTIINTGTDVNYMANARLRSINKAADELHQQHRQSYSYGYNYDRRISNSTTLVDLSSSNRFSFPGKLRLRGSISTNKRDTVLSLDNSLAAMSSSARTLNPYPTGFIPKTQDPEFFYSLTALNRFGKPFSFETLRNKVVLVVNVASKCNFTPQYMELQKLYETYKDKGLMILAFPTSQFGLNQEFDKMGEIFQFCKTNFGITFPIMQKIKVNGSDAHPAYTYMKSRKSRAFGLRRVTWNFEKFVINRKGVVVKRYPSYKKPKSLKNLIEKLLNEKPKIPCEEE